MQHQPEHDAQLAALDRQSSTTALILLTFRPRSDQAITQEPPRFNRES